MIFFLNSYLETLHLLFVLSQDCGFELQRAAWFLGSGFERPLLLLFLLLVVERRSRFKQLPLDRRSEFNWLLFLARSGHFFITGPSVFCTLTFGRLLLGMGADFLLTTPTPLAPPTAEPFTAGTLLPTNPDSKWPPFSPNLSVVLVIEATPTPFFPIIVAIFVVVVVVVDDDDASPFLQSCLPVVSRKNPANLSSCTSRINLDIPAKSLTLFICSLVVCQPNQPDSPSKRWKKDGLLNSSLRVSKSSSMSFFLL